ncbi:2-phospho-L-lactate guanylyltransferase [Cohaesibacter intestini]|uniref:2-phospho-L-lactate guanylyltransferase n=1 Tax=Cohaesibacter intestini TaxID=2211145 RepID=UPI000DE96607|nr:2-phospho-L-lactate guanylyltransferase [Cohaesibacter intestini]
MTTDIARTLLVIPMKDPKDAKTRLGSGLDRKERATLALSLFDMLVKRIQSVLAARDAFADQVIDIAVVSASPILKQAAQRLGIHHIAEGQKKGLSNALDHAAKEALALGYQAMLILPGDLADPKPADLSRLIDHAATGETAVICPSSDWGTNALLLPLPNPIAFQFGEKSFHNHYRAMTEAGLTPILLPLTSLRLDVDRLDDLRHLSRDHWHLLAKGDGR